MSKPKKTAGLDTSEENEAGPVPGDAGDGQDSQEIRADESKVTVIAKCAFRNEKLNLKATKKEQELSVTAEVAEFLVNEDRTCKYPDKR